MDKFYLIANSEKDQGKKLSMYIQHYLEGKGKQCILSHQIEYSKAAEYRYTNPDLIPENIDCILVLGGDGTMIQAARDVMYRNIPMLGINRGTLGYLAEVDIQTIPSALDCLIQDDYTIENRMMLQGRVSINGQMISHNYALNDIVISRGRSMRVNYYNIYVDGELLNKYTADGIIVATPTGSTAYSLSAGGPFVDPKAEMFIITPISAHTLQNRSIVLSSQSKISIEISSIAEKEVEPCLAFFDGNEVAQLGYGDMVEIVKADFTTQIIKVNNISFLETLRRKMME